MMTAVKVVSVVLAIAVLAGAAPVPDKSLFEQQTELYNSMLVQEEAVADESVSDPAELDPELKAEIVAKGADAKGPSVWVDRSTAPKLDDVSGPTTAVDESGEAHDIDWGPPATAIARNCMQLKVFGYTSVDYREDIKEPNRALGVLNDMFDDIAPGMYNTTNETPEACVKEYNTFVLNIKKGCDEVESIPCKMIEAIQQSMQKGGLLKKSIDDEDYGKRKTSIDAVAVGLAEADALGDVDIGVTDSEIALTLRDMKDEYAKAMSHVPASPRASEPSLSSEDVDKYDHWDGK